MDQPIAARDRPSDAEMARLRARLLALAGAASLEISARDRTADLLCRDLLGQGRSVYITHAPTDTTPGMVAAAVRLRRAGLNPVPHVAARAIASYTRLNDYLARAAGEAGVARILLVAGDADQPAGPYRSSLELLETGLLDKHAIREIGFAGYPEGHPRIAAATLATALADKLALCRRAGLAPFVMTQFCLEAAPIARWIAQARAAGISCPIHVGLAGPTAVASLAKFAVRCGIGRSIGALVRGQTSVTRLLTETGPEPLLHALAGAPELPIDGLHLFTFGGVARTAGWLGALQRGDFTLCPEGDSFRVN
jgi:methylenetetrahydrofolate reductase (NADPH)